MFTASWMRMIVIKYKVRHSFLSEKEMLSAVLQRCGNCGDSGLVVNHFVFCCDLFVFPQFPLFPLSPQAFFFAETLEWVFRA